MQVKVAGVRPPRTTSSKGYLLLRLGSQAKFEVFGRRWLCSFITAACVASTLGAEGKRRGRKGEREREARSAQSRRVTGLRSHLWFTGKSGFCTCSCVLYGVGRCESSAWVQAEVASRARHCLYCSRCSAASLRCRASAAGPEERACCRR
ncbi:hypothetical protein BJV77DRAFT_610981 [Russula vinacea]|nr:hypothetical protein BJV77DRAFT_610981 [Russula vinacea]